MLAFWGSTNEVANYRRNYGADQQHDQLGRQGKWSDNGGQCAHVDTRVNGSSSRRVFLATIPIRAERP